MAVGNVSGDIAPTPVIGVPVPTAMPVMLGAPPVENTPKDLRESYDLLVERVLPQARSELR